MMKANLNRVEIMDETKRRQLVIEWCLKKGIRDYKDFARVVAEYYVHPEDVMRQVTKICKSVVRSADVKLKKGI